MHQLSEKNEEPFTPTGFIEPWEKLSDWEISEFFARNDLSQSNHFQLYKFDINRIRKQLRQAKNKIEEYTLLTLPDPFSNKIKFQLQSSGTDTKNAIERFIGHSYSDTELKIRLDLSDSGIKVIITSRTDLWRITSIDKKTNIYIIYRDATSFQKDFY